MFVCETQCRARDPAGDVGTPNTQDLSLRSRSTPEAASRRAGENAASRLCSVGEGGREGGRGEGDGLNGPWEQGHGGVSESRAKATCGQELS
ncbi:hypothetical protein E2C01_051343 [Portunus trituberculatus]|uniref:Uncharacterized protein n=1 Tax=Portunus trituberculatus TaxID=210409 RepID=A0A5B7GLJ4_PORTR|nr:hypothetical protein [Portunus trituberculatus]